MKVLRTKGVDRGKDKRVFIAIPSFRDISSETLYSMYGVQLRLLENDIESELEVLTENCHVDDGRNYLVRDFLESDCTDLVFIDADVRFDPDDLVKLIKYPFGVVAGIYPKKTNKTEYPVKFLDHSESPEIWSNEHGLIEVAGVPTGFLKIARSVLEILYENCPKYIPQTEQTYHRLRIPLIFERKLNGIERLGGDYEFCRKWRELGGQIYADPAMHFGHVGTEEWTGVWGNHLLRQNNLLDEYIVSTIQKIKDGKADMWDYMQLWDAWGNEWAAPVDLLVGLADIGREHKGKILELGSGLTSLVLGAVSDNVTILENNKDWYERVYKYINLCKQDSVILPTPLKDGWYDVNLQDEFSFIVVDGPARDEGDRSKFLERVKQSGDCIYVIDDVSPFMNNMDVDFKFFGRYAIGRK